MNALNCGEKGCLGAYYVAISPRLSSNLPGINKILKQCNIYLEQVELSSSSFSSAFVSPRPMIILFSDIGDFPVVFPDLEELYEAIDRDASTRNILKLTDGSGAYIEKKCGGSMIA